MKSDVSEKVAAGYIIIIVLLAAAALCVFISVKSLARQYEQERIIDDRRHTVTMFLSSALAAEEAAQLAVADGSDSTLAFYDSALMSMKQLADSLRQKSINADVDSLLALMERKRHTVEELAMTRSHNDELINFQRVVGNIITERDSSLGHTVIRETIHHEREVTVREQDDNFFKRLGRAFKPGKRDTLLVSGNESLTKSDTTVSTISDNLSSRFDRARRMAVSARLERSRTYDSKVKALQRDNLEMSVKLNQLIDNIRREQDVITSYELSEVASHRNFLIWVLCVIALLGLGSAGVFFILIRRDVRKATQYRSEIEDSNLHVSRLLEERESMLLTITHDLKSPAASVMGYAKALTSTSLDDYQNMCAGNIYRSGERMLRLAGSLLDYHRIEAGQASEVHDDASPTSLIEDIITTHKPTADSKGLKLTGECSDECRMKYSFDSSRLRTIVDNLVSNAIKYTSRGEVAVTASVTNDILSISVADTGCGISPLELQRIFARFARTPGSEHIEGTGIGLSVVSSMASLIGAELSVESTPGSGSVFNVSLKVNPAENADEEPDESSSPALLPAFDFSLRILIVDDDPLQRRLVAMALKSGGLANSPIEAGSAAEAMDLCSENRPDVVITDLQMPHISGEQLCDDLHELYPGLPVIALSAADARMSGIDTERFYGVLTKPFDEFELFDLLSGINPERISLKGFTQFAEGDADAEYDILEALRSQCREAIINLEQALGDADIKQASATAHKILPSLKLARSKSTKKAEMLEGKGEYANQSDDERMACIPEIVTALYAIINTVDETIGNDENE